MNKYEITKEIKEAIVLEMEDELDRRDYVYNRIHLKTIVDKSVKRKKNLIELLSKHPNWNKEKLMIQFDADIERKMDFDQIYVFTNWLQDKARIKAPSSWFNVPETREYEVVRFMQGIRDQFFDSTMQDRIDEVNKLNPNFKLRSNMKASKAIGKICREEGWDKLDGFNQAYATLCNALSPLKIKRHTCISLNPMDYLLMSNGNSWSSCHDIDNAYDDPGCYSSGTISYMLDEHSFIFYTVDAAYDGNEIERQPKIQRQVFGYNDEVLAQLRLYPQDNDFGAEQTYTDIREIVQKVVSDCLGKPNLWVRSKKDVEEVCSKGNGATCYPDWKKCNPGGEHCSISTLKEREDGKEFRQIIFGARPICIECGSDNYDTDNISCCNGSYRYCEHCGERIHEVDIRWGGYWEDIPYCEDCVTYCEDCDRYYLNDEVNYIDGYHVCNDCLKNGDYYECENCGEIHYSDNMVCTEDGEHCYCRDCANEYTFVCDQCCNRHETEDMFHDEETGLDLCEYCYNELLRERNQAS